MLPADTDDVDSLETGNVIPMDWHAMMDDSELLKRLFGRPTRIHLALWVIGRDREPFYLLEAQTALLRDGHALSATRAEVQTLLHCGLLIETPDGNRKYYTPTESPWWDVFAHIGRALTVTVTAPPPPL